MINNPGDVPDMINNLGDELKMISNPIVDPYMINNSCDEPTMKNNPNKQPRGDLHRKKKLQRDTYTFSARRKPLNILGMMFQHR